MDSIRVGLALRAVRIRLGLRQIDLARRARVSRGAVSAIELGRWEEVSLAELERVAHALGARLDVAVRWKGERLDRLLDEAHAATVAAMVVRLEHDRWLVAVEATFSIWGERGSIDILAWHPATETVLVVEVKSVIPDLQALLYGVDRKARLAPEIAGQRGWRPSTVGRLLVVAESPTSRGRVRRHSTVLDAALPARGAEVRTWLRAPSGPLAGLLFLSNASQGGTTGSSWRRERVRPINRVSRAVQKLPDASEQGNQQELAASPQPTDP